MSRIIDCTTDPFVPDGWEVEHHNTDLGQIDWNEIEVTLYLSSEQEGGSISDEELLAALSDESVLNANVLDYLLENPELIPEDWKGKSIFFWGTIYRNDRRWRVVRYLCWEGDDQYWVSRWLDRGFGDDCPAAVLAS